MLDTTINTIELDNLSRDLTTEELGTITKMVATLPGRWTAETEQTDGQRYVGLVGSSTDKRAFPVLIGGLQGGVVEATDWTGRVLATGVAMTDAFQAIRAVLPAGGRRIGH